MENMTWHGLNKGQELFSLLMQTLPTFGAERILILTIRIVVLFCYSPKFGAGPGLGLGQACGGLVISFFSDFN